MLGKLARPPRVSKLTSIQSLCIIDYSIFMSSLKTGLIEDQAGGQSEACLPALKRDIVSPANRWRNHSDGFKKEIFGCCCLQWIAL